MIKKFLAIGVAAFSLASCGNDFDTAAQAMCDCMAEAEAGETEDLGFDMSSINYGACALSVGVDIKDEQFAKSIESKCPDLSDTHTEYIEGL